MGNSDGDSRPAVATLTPDLKEDIELWLSADVARRNGSLDRIVSRGAAAASALVELMFQNAKETGRQIQIQTALREIGPAAFQTIADALNRVPAVRNARDCSILEDLTETILSLDARRAAPVALAQLEKLGAVPLRNRVMAEQINNARLRLVVKLAAAGCADAIEEVIAYLGDGSMLVPLAVLDVLEKSGNSSALLPLLRLFPRQNAASEHSGRQIQEAFRAIAKREKLTAESPCLTGCASSEMELALKWLSKK